MKFWEQRPTKGVLFYRTGEALEKASSSQQILKKGKAYKSIQVFSMNQIILTGRLTAEPTVTYSSGKEPVAHAVFNFAVPDMSMKKSENGNYPTDFFRCSAWSKLAEVIESYCSKGTKLMVIGRLKNNNYEKDGQKIYSNEILIDSLEFLETKKPE